MFLREMGNCAFENTETGLRHKNVKYVHPQRMIKGRLEKEMLQQMLNVQGFYFGQNKKSSNNVDEDKRKWIKKKISNFEHF